ncbi:acyl-CoA dehydrogenase family protein [Sandaracinobacteroides saxicola]|uniref:Acyl-CoA/acyl-ACP dehydrogenase n=1 Tax=Sandaracinobacteroides saxicola TaxID=2759707 RepID=A0A7G5IIB9_9SPHN|nr:acyl-CoA dehydrogenase family protein [Sandaracinobacteroides saxicola]QMW23111.1 acyl-CoA/acyl-ACP dehydrogenase [Sandaracinobacteroides saxicola]
MNFDLSDDAKTLRDAARKFLDAKAGPAVARAQMGREAPFDSALWAEVVGQGWTALRIPEAHGGIGLGADEVCVLAEEVGRSLAPVPLTSTLAATEALLLAGTEAQRAAWLPRIAAGEVVAVIAWSEGAKAISAMPATVLAAGTVRGVKSPVPDLMGAHLAIVTVASADGPAMALVDLAGPGVSRADVESLDLVRRSGTLTLDGAAAEPLGTAADWAKLCDRLAVIAAFETLGSARAAMDMTVAYAKDRTAFGLRIGRYQGVKHKLADMYIKVTLAEAHALHGAWAFGSDAPELSQAAAAARVSSLEAMNYVAEEAVQLHGGIGFTWEHDCQFYYRRNRTLQFALGSRAHWADRLVRALERRNRQAA